jgi:twitching motility protein PilT
MGHRVIFRLDEQHDAVEVQFGRAGTTPAIMIRRAPKEAAAAAATVAPAPFESAPEVVRPPQAQPAAVPEPATEPPPPPPPPVVKLSSMRRVSAAPSGAEKEIDALLRRMLEAGASDVHLMTGVPPYFRVDGDLAPDAASAPLTGADLERTIAQILPERGKHELAEKNDCDFAYEIPGEARFRVNVFRDRRGLGAVLRQIPIEVLTATQLGLPPAVVQLGDLSKGLVLVTGPTGSGKSTTLAAIVDYMNESRRDHIITIEDPIEFLHGNKKCLVNQREVGTHTPGFKHALRAALREDPDIVLVGEMRDLETTAIAIETAETGHLVFGTLHTTTATSTVDRIVDQFPADRQQQIRMMLADSLRAVVAQTLLKRIGGGRIAALEVLLSNPAVANLIRDGKTFQLPSILQTSKAQGMVLLNDALLELVKRGLVEPREAYMKAVDKNGLLSTFKSHGIRFGPEGAPAGAPPAAPPGA